MKNRLRVKTEKTVAIFRREVWIGAGNKVSRVNSAIAEEEVNEKSPLYKVSLCFSEMTEFELEAAINILEKARRDIVKISRARGAP